MKALWEAIMRQYWLFKARREFKQLVKQANKSLTQVLK